MILSLAKTGNFIHPLIKKPGWWHGHNNTYTHSKEGQNPLLFFGGNDRLWNVVREICERRSLDYFVVSPKQLATY